MEDDVSMVEEKNAVYNIRHRTFYFARENVIALKSANETKYWLSLIKETLDLDKERISSFLKEASEISNIIATIIINSKEIKK